MKYSELVAALKAAGCYITRHGANHDVWYSPVTQKPVIVPRHGSHEVPKGTERSIKKKAGI